MIWQHPDGTTVDLALARHRATDPDRRIGSLLLNPGGPGQSGVNLALSAPFSFSPELAARFDFVGFDPRGIGGSAEMRCDKEEVDARRTALNPTDEASFQTLREANRWATNAAHQMDREAHLLTYDGVGHITYWRSPCMRQATDTYPTPLR
ncbi:alpha/beta hydrolase [Streptomyces sp. GQFP]|uniref:alpha/beta hydrolase n=1 Tax=Streptomyces sp. GQFP TaxID=2907545 RepID=UPI001F2D6161|nr:alpha/beta hydrolase [Streptomyces sp. GQFP]UIX30590.1 alpha/beta hydrolase [Streptomyces sp. GQFP]